MNLFLNIVSALLIFACLIYITVKKDKNILVMTISLILLAALLTQIILDEVVRVQMLALESIEDINKLVSIVKIIDWCKYGVIVILAAYYYFVNAKSDKVEDEL